MVKGCDVSHWNGDIDCQQLKAQGYEFLFAKATEGAYLFDDTYLDNRENAEKAGLMFGPYHFFHPSQDPVAQAEFFIRKAGSFKGMLLPMLDWEVSDGLRPSIQIAKAQVFLDILEKEVGRPPFVYSYESYFSQLALQPSFAKYPLWVAQYAQRVTIPHPWSQYTIWQYAADHGLDKDQFIGSTDDLAKFVII
jgi:lysozyme